MKVEVERGLFDGLTVEIDFIDFKVVLSQNGDCKGNIDVVDMVGTKPALGLLGRREASEVVRAACDAKIWDVKTTDNKEALWRPLVWDRKQVRNSIIAQTSEKRGGRVKSGEVLDLIYILYRETGLLSIFIMSSGCKVVIPTFLRGQSRRSPSMRNRGIGQSIPSKRRKRPFLFSFPR